MEYLQKNVDITKFSNFKTPAKTNYFFEIKKEEDILKLKKVFKEYLNQEENIKLNLKGQEQIKSLFIGGGTNILFAFDTFKGIVIKNSLNGFKYDKNKKVLEIYSDEYISNISEILEKDYGQKIWHRFIGLPGTIGGAIFGNAGCFGLEAENNLSEVTVYNFKTGQIEILGKKDCDFSYRNSIFKKTGNYFIIKAKFDLSKKIEKYSSEVDNIYFREFKQPKGNTCGSFFKNPKVDIEKFLKDFPDLCEGNVKIVSAGFLIEKAGLKNFKLGGAYFSDIHSNFLMNDGTGTYQDLLDLIDLTQKKVEEKFGIELIPEVRIIK